MDPGDIVLLVVAGAACGLGNSSAGGGSLILFPALLVTGLHPLAANVTNSVATWPGYLGGVGALRAEIGQRKHLLPPLLVGLLARGRGPPRRRLHRTLGVLAALGAAALALAAACLAHPALRRSTWSLLHRRQATT